MSMRSVEEIHEALNEMIARQWYDRSQLTRDEHDDIGASERRMLEAKYGSENLGPYSDFEWGAISGKRAALQWLLGGEWDDPQDT